MYPVKVPMGIGRLSERICRFYYFCRHADFDGLFREYLPVPYC